MNKKIPYQHDIPVPYEDLTPNQKKIICNGCGGKGGWIKPPYKAFFKASCNHHDYGYWKGGYESDRKYCDYKFYKAMKKDCSDLPWYKYLRYRPWCWIYYIAVRKFGEKYFHYGEKRWPIE